MKVIASAPTKIIICGEHAVVHGANSIAAPISFRNKIILEKRPGKPRLLMEDNPASKWWASLEEDGKIDGNPIMQGYMLMAQHIFAECKSSLSKVGFLHAEKRLAASPKGTGNSSSIAAALACALYAFLGETPSKEQLFQSIQIAEKYAHANPSGVDARAVISDCAQRFHKEWGSQGRVNYFFEDANLVLPEGTALLLIDSCRADEKPLPTADLVTSFSLHRFSKMPTELTASDRKKVCLEFNPLTQKIEGQLQAKGNPVLLGKYFNENHELLAKSGLSASGIEEARKLALSEGAFGAKITGAGGPCGAVIALVPKEKIAKIKSALEKKGFKCFEAKFSEKGACVESKE